MSTWLRQMGLNVDALRAVEPPEAETPGRTLETTVAPSMFEGLGPHANAVAVAVAVLGREAPLRHIAELVELTMAETLAAVDVLTAADVLANSVPLSFREAHTAERVLSSLPVGTQVAVRLRAAEFLRTVPGNGERVAHQLLEIGPIGLDWAGHVLTEASAAALDRGDKRAAATYLRNALAEPLAVDDRLAYTLRLAAVLADIDPMAGLKHIVHELRRPDTQPDVSATMAVLHQLTSRLRNTVEAVRLLEAAAELLGLHDSAAAVRLLIAEAGLIVPYPGATSRLTELERRLVRTGIPDPCARRALDAVRACLDALREPRAGAAVDLANAVLADADADREWDTCQLALYALVLAGDDVAVLSACQRLDTELGAGGADKHGFSRQLVVAHCLRRQGRLLETAASLESLLAQCAEQGFRRDHPIAVIAAANLAETLVHTGEASRSKRILVEHGLDRSDGDPSTSMWVLRSRGAVAAAHGEWDAALADQLACGRRVTEWAEVNADVLPWRFEAVVTLMRSGRQEEARSLATIDLTVAQTRDTPHARGYATYALAMCEQGHRRQELLAEAVRLLHAGGFTLAEAHARHDLAEALRTAERITEAEREHVQAQELGKRCGVAAVGPWFGEPVHNVGDRPVLTPQERRIARLVVQGRNNAEIAAELALARRTVEFHLSGVYRKLGITGRHELAACDTAEID